MNKKMAVIIGAVILVFIAAIALIAGMRHAPKATAAELTMWGTPPPEIFNGAISKYENLIKGTRITYVQKRPETFEAELLNALAAGRGPDIWLADQDLIKTHEDKIAKLPTILFSASEFKNRFIDLAEFLYLRPDERQRIRRIIALPLWADPLVLYWNKDLFNASAIPAPPKTWTGLANSSQKLTKRVPSGNITVSGIAMGRARNIPLFRDIIGALLLQQNVDIVNSDGRVIFGASIGENQTRLNPTESVIRFYTDFANPGRNTYAWNPALENPKNRFLEGTLAMMLGYASDINDIRRRNPHLRFGITSIPQVEESQTPLTVARLPGAVVSRISEKQMAAWQFLLWLTSDAAVPSFTDQQYVAPAVRALLVNTQEKEFWSVLVSSALQARWLNDPIPKTTSALFHDMIETVANRQKTVSEAVQEVQVKIQTAIRAQ